MDRNVTIETAKFACMKGFAIPVNGYFMSSGRYFTSDERKNHNSYNYSKLKWSAPTQSTLQAWFRDLHSIHISPSFNLGTKEFGGWTLCVTSLDSSAHALRLKISDRFETIYFEEGRTFQ